jgi:hypothetical protein
LRELNSGTALFQMLSCSSFVSYDFRLRLLPQSAHLAPVQEAAVAAVEEVAAALV